MYELDRFQTTYRSFAGKLLQTVLLLFVGTFVLVAVVPDTPTAQSNSSYSIDYRLREPGQVSAAVFNEQGRILRTLLRGRKQKAGKHTVYWDGLDRHGIPQEGQATVRILRTPGFQAEYVTNIGINPGSASYHMWLGEHYEPSSFAIDSTGKYYGSEFTETVGPLVKESLDGTERIWGGSRAMRRQLKGRWVMVPSNLRWRSPRRWGLPSVRRNVCS